MEKCVVGDQLHKQTCWVLTLRLMVGCAERATTLEAHFVEKIIVELLGLEANGVVRFQ